MSDLLTSGTSDYATTGTPDTQTPRSNGVNGSFIDAEIVNGVAKAIVDLQTLLGNALTLKGQMSSLSSRLQRILEDDGAVRKGTSFPSTPVPVEGDIFYRTDLITLYTYDGSTWRTMFEGAGGTTIDHGSIAGLADDDHTIYFLIDGSRAATGNVQVKKSVPFLRMKGTEANAQEFAFSENTGDFYLYENSGTEGSPVWTTRAKYDRASGQWQLIGNLSVSGSILTPTVTVPVIASFASANHNHADSAGGGALGASTIIRSTLKTSVGGISGTLGSLSTVNILLDAYSFFPMIQFDDPVNVQLEPHATDGGSADAPRFRVRETGSAPQGYNIDWRYIAPS